MRKGLRPAASTPGPVSQGPGTLFPQPGSCVAAMHRPLPNCLRSAASCGLAAHKLSILCLITRRLYTKINKVKHTLLTKPAHFVKNPYICYANPITIFTPILSTHTVMTRKLTHYAMLLATALFCLGLHSCSLFDDDDEDGYGELGGDTPPESLYGTWYFDNEESITFYSDGCGYMVSQAMGVNAPARPLQYIYTQYINFDYRYDAATNRLTIVNQDTGEYSTWEITLLTDNEFSFRDLSAGSNGQTYTGTKEQPDDNEEQPGDNEDDSPTIDESFYDKLCYKKWWSESYWEGGSYYRLIFYPDGSGYYDYLDAEGNCLDMADTYWEYDPEENTLTAYFGGKMTKAYILELSDEYLTVMTEDGEYISFRSA